MVAFPRFLAYDAFEQDLNAIDIWERLQTLDYKLKDLMTHSLGAINIFLKAMATKVNMGEDTVQLKTSTFINSPTPTTTEWTKQHMQQLFSSLHSTANTQKVL